MASQMNKRENFKSWVHSLYLENRGVDYDPDDHLDPIFYPITSSKMGEQCDKFKTAVTNLALKVKVDPTPDMDSLDYEYEYPTLPTPTDEEIIKVAFPCNSGLGVSFDDVTENGTLQDTYAVDYNLRRKSWLQPAVGSKFQAHLWVDRVIDLNPVKFEAENFKNTVRSFRTNVGDSQRLNLNAQNFSFILDTIKITRSAYENVLLSKEGKRGKGYILVNYSNDEELIEIPTCLSIVDTLKDVIHFRFDIHEEETDREHHQRFHIGVGNIPEHVVAFWKSLPALCSDGGAEESIKCINRWLKDFHQCDVQLRGFDIASLAVTAGVKLDQYNLNALNMVTFGTPIADWVYNVDNSTAKDRSLSNSDDWWFFHYKYWRFSSLVNMYAILFGHILRTIWPDPDVVLCHFRLNQPLFFKWWSLVLGSSLSQGKVIPGLDMTNLTRYQMIQSLSSESELIQLLSELWIPVPALSFGGPRWLHSTRYGFKGQYYVVRKITVGRLLDHGNVRYPDATEDIASHENHIMYGRKYCVDDSGVGIKGRLVDSQLDLHCNPQYSEDLYVLDTDIDIVDKLESQNNRPVVLSVLEWARLDILGAKALLDRLRSLSDKELIPFWGKKLTLYTGIRNMIGNILCESEFVDSLEYLFAASKENVSRELARNETELKLCLMKNRRVALQEITPPDLPLNPGLHQTIYKRLPGENQQKNADRRKVRNANRKKHKNLPGYETFTQQKLRKRYNKLLTRDLLAIESGVPGTRVSLPITNETIPSTSSTKKLLSFDVKAKKHDGKRKKGWKKRSKRFTDLREKLLAKNKNQ